MKIKQIHNEIGSEIIQRKVADLRAKGWRVKFKHRPTRFICNYKHINFRGKTDSDMRINWHTYISGWVFEVHVRNRNGGYTRELQEADLDRAIAAAEQFAQQDEPEIPTWDRTQVPDPFPLSNHKNIIRYQERIGQDTIVISFESLITEIKAIGVVSISKNCGVSVDASLSKGQKAWFLFECGGTEGNFRIITDGDGYYPVKPLKLPKSKRSSRGRSGWVDPKDRPYKLALDLKVSKTIDLSQQMTDRDRQCIAIACQRYADWYAQKFG